MSPFLTLPLTILGAASPIAAALRRARARQPADPWDTWAARAAADLERRRRFCIARMGRRWILHPDNQVQRKCSR
jgi:hypothetical protein